MIKFEMTDCHQVEIMYQQVEIMYLQVEIMYLPGHLGVSTYFT